MICILAFPQMSSPKFIDTDTSIVVSMPPNEIKFLPCLLDKNIFMPIFSFVDLVHLRPLIPICHPAHIANMDLPH